MSSITQAKKAMKQRQAAAAATGAQRPNYQPKPAEAPAEPDFRFTAWRPHDLENQQRFWQPPRVGDIVQCKFPNFLRSTFDFSQRKSRPAMIVGVEEFASGQTIVKVAYGTSRVNDDLNSKNEKVLGHGLEPGELLVEAATPKTGLEMDTKFSLRKVVSLPFDNEYFTANPTMQFGKHPKRGIFDMKDPVNRRAMDIVIREAMDLGSELDGDGPTAKLKSARLGA